MTKRRMHGLRGGRWALLLLSGLLLEGCQSLDEILKSAHRGKAPITSR